MTHVTCRLTAENRDHLRNPTLGNRVRAIFTFLMSVVCCLSDDINLIIYVSAAAAAAVAIVTVLSLIITWRLSSTANAAARPPVSASPVAVSSRPPPARHHGFAPAHLCSHGYLGYHGNGYYGNERCARRLNPRCFHSRISVYSNPFQKRF